MIPKSEADKIVENKDATWSEAHERFIYDVLDKELWVSQNRQIENDPDRIDLVCLGEVTTAVVESKMGKQYLTMNMVDGMRFSFTIEKE